MKIDSAGKLYWEDMRPFLAEELKGKDFHQTQELYARWNQTFQEVDGGRLYADWVRSMILIDRYFLLTEVLIPAKLKTIALNPWLFDRVREVEAEPNGHLDLWAREHFKTSSITHAGSIQEILKDPEITIGIFSHTKGIAKKILVSIKNDLENNETLKACFPDVLYKNPKKESPMWTLEKFIVKRKDNPREATCEAWGVVDGQPTGAHFKLRIYDDLVTAESVNTPEQIEKTTEMLALSDNLGTQGGRVWYIGTRYSYGDTYQHMMDKGQVKTRIHPATHNGRLEGNPVFFTPEYWEEKKRSQTISTLACQMLQNPNAGSQAMFSISHLRFYRRRPEVINVYILVDPASSMKRGSDKTAMVVIGVDSTGNKFLLDGYHHKMDLSEKFKLLSSLVGNWQRKSGVQLVKVGYEKYGMQNDIEHMRLEMERGGNRFEIHELNTPRSGGGAKRDRMSRLEPDIRGGKFYLPAIVGETWRREVPTKLGPVLMEGDRMEVRIGVDERTGSPKAQKSPRTRDMLTRDPDFSDIDFGARAIRRKWRDGNRDVAYDVTLDFIKQLETVPNNSAHDDLVDAASRIYDIDYTLPVLYASSALAPPAFAD